MQKYRLGFTFEFNSILYNRIKFNGYNLTSKNCDLFLQNFVFVTIKMQKDKLFLDISKFCSFQTDNNVLTGVFAV